MDFINLTAGIFLIQSGIQTNLLSVSGWKEAIVTSVIGLIQIVTGAYFIDQYIHTLL